MRAALLIVVLLLPAPAMAQPCERDPVGEAIELRVAELKANANANPNAMPWMMAGFGLLFGAVLSVVAMVLATQTTSIEVVVAPPP